MIEREGQQADPLLGFLTDADMARAWRGAVAETSARGQEGEQED